MIRIKDDGTVVDREEYRAILAGVSLGGDDVDRSMDELKGLAEADGSLPVFAVNRPCASSAAHSALQALVMGLFRRAFRVDKFKPQAILQRVIGFAVGNGVINHGVDFLCAHFHPDFIHANAYGGIVDGLGANVGFVCVCGLL